MPKKIKFDLSGHLERVLEDTSYSVDFGTFKLALYFYNEFDNEKYFVAHIPYNSRYSFQLENAKILHDILDIFGVTYGD